MSYALGDKLVVELNGNILIAMGKMTGPYCRFSSGKVGYFDYDFFKWRGEGWGIRFLSVPQRSWKDWNTTYGPLGGPDLYIRVDRPSNLAVPQKFLEEAKQYHKEKSKERKLWQVSDGVRARFNLTRCIRKLPSGELGAFESFQTELEGRYYWGSFLIIEKPYPQDKPVAWEPSSGPSAGLPGLGRRR